MLDATASRHTAATRAGAPRPAGRGDSPARSRTRARSSRASWPAVSTPSARRRCPSACAIADDRGDDRRVAVAVLAEVGDEGAVDLDHVDRDSGAGSRATSSRCRSRRARAARRASRSARSVSIVPSESSSSRPSVSSSHSASAGRPVSASASATCSTSPGCGRPGGRRGSRSGRRSGIGVWRASARPGGRRRAGSARPSAPISPRSSATGMKSDGAIEAVLRMVPAHQRLDAAIAAAGAVDRLIGDPQLVRAVERAPQVLLHPHARGHAGALRGVVQLHRGRGRAPWRGTSRPRRWRSGRRRAARRGEGDADAGGDEALAPSTVNGSANA